MKQSLTIISLLLFVFATKAQTKGIVGKLKNEEGQIIVMYDDLSYDNQFGEFIYKDEAGKSKRIKEKKIEWITFKTYYDTVTCFYRTVEKKDKRFMRLLAVSDKYKLYVPYHASNIYYVFDSKDEFVEKFTIKEKVSFTGNSTYQEAQYKTLLTSLKKYFGDCSNLIEFWETCIKDKRSFEWSYKGCNGNPTIEQILK